MKAIILLTTNPGFQEQAYSTLDEVMKGRAIKGVKPASILHCFGRVDGVIMCEVADAKALSALTEALRKKGVFQTETLIGID